MGGKLGTHSLARFKLGDSTVEEAAAATVVSGMFDAATPTGAHFDPPTPA